MSSGALTNTVIAVFKDTHREKDLSNETQRLKKVQIWAFGVQQINSL